MGASGATPDPKKRFQSSRQSISSPCSPSDLSQNDFADTSALGPGMPVGPKAGSATGRKGYREEEDFDSEEGTGRRGAGKGPRKEQEKQISSRKEEAQRDLDAAEPALQDAKAAVKSIRKRDLDEVRNLLRPPPNVQITLECVAVMLGETNLDWANVKKTVSRADFIPNILGFAADKLTDRQVKYIRKAYLDGNESINYDLVMRSSKA